MENKNNEVTKIEVATEKVADLEKDLENAASAKKLEELAVKTAEESKFKAFAKRTFIGGAVIAGGALVYNALKEKSPDEIRAEAEVKATKAQAKLDKKQAKKEAKAKKAERKNALKEFKKNPDQFLTANADEVEPADVEETEN